MTTTISTNGRNALKVMLDLSEHDGWVPLVDIANRQGVSRKHLEQVVALLARAGFVEGQRGKGGGYRLTRTPSAYTLGSIIRVAQKGSLAPVACLDCVRGELCPRAESCRTLPLWTELGKLISDFLDSKTLADLKPLT